MLRCVQRALCTSGKATTCRRSIQGRSVSGLFLSVGSKRMAVGRGNDGRSIFCAPFHGTPATFHGHDHDDPNAEPVTVTYVLKDGERITVEGREGNNILRLGQKHDIPLEGACEGVCACSTCHVIVKDEYFDRLPYAEDEEEDMLDLAWGLKSTSRLGCQIELTTELEGIEVTLPSATRNFYVDGHVPEPH